MIESTYVRVDLCVDSPTNPRRETDSAALAELTESVRQHGILQPIVVRAVNSGCRFEVVCGSRRLLAARAADLEEIPATVHDLTDEQAMVIQIEENAQREDLSPIDEADGYQKLLDLGRSVEEIAANCHKSKATIYGRLNLLNLPDEAVEAMRDGRLAPSIATLIGRIPDMVLRAAATKEILIGRWDREVATFNEAKQLIRTSFTNSLAKAPFDPTASDLLDDVGACTHCPNRTGNNESLFGDLVSDDAAGPDVCTNPPCYAKKRTAHASAELAAAKAKGLKIIPIEKSGKVFGDHGGTCLSPSSKYVEPGDRCPADTKGRSWEALLGREMPQFVVAVDGSGAARHLLPRREAQAALEAKYPSAKPQQLREQESGGATIAKARAERELREETSDAYRAVLTTAAEGDKMRTPPQDAWKALAAAAVARTDRNGDGEHLVSACLRRGLIEADEADGAAPRKLTTALFAWLEKCTGAQARGLLVELTVIIIHNQYGPPYLKQVVAAVDEAFGIDRKAIAATVRASLKAKAKETEPAETTKPKKAGGRKRRAAQEVPDEQG